MTVVEILILEPNVVNLQTLRARAMKFEQHSLAQYGWQVSGNLPVTNNLGKIILSVEAFSPNDPKYVRD